LVVQSAGPEAQQASLTCGSHRCLQSSAALDGRTAVREYQRDKEQEYFSDGRPPRNIRGFSIGCGLSATSASFFLPLLNRDQLTGENAVELPRVESERRTWNRRPHKTDVMRFQGTAVHA
jgi:hypothetical protein